MFIIDSIRFWVQVGRNLVEREISEAAAAKDRSATVSRHIHQAFQDVSGSLARPLECKLHFFFPFLDDSFLMYRCRELVTGKGPRCK